MSIPIQVYINIPISPYTNYEIIYYILNELYNSNIYPLIENINYVLLNEGFRRSEAEVKTHFPSQAPENGNNIDFKNILKSINGNVLPKYFSKLNCVLENIDSQDASPIMSSLYYFIANNSACYYNIFFINLQKIFNSTMTNQTSIEKWINYLVYFYIQNSYDCIGNLSVSNVAGVDLIEASPFSYYLSDWWWTDSNYIKTLRYSNMKCTPFITDGTDGGFYISVWTSLNWISQQEESAKFYDSSFYQDKDLIITSVSIDNGYTIGLNPLCFKPIVPEKYSSKNIVKPTRQFSLNIFLNNYEKPENPWVKSEITPCEYRRRLLSWNKPKPSPNTPVKENIVFQFLTPKKSKLRDL